MAPCIGLDGGEVGTASGGGGGGNGKMWECGQTGSASWSGRRGLARACSNIGWQGGQKPCRPVGEREQDAAGTGRGDARPNMCREQGTKCVGRTEGTTMKGLKKYPPA